MSQNDLLQEMVGAPVEPLVQRQEEPGIISQGIEAAQNLDLAGVQESVGEAVGKAQEFGKELWDRSWGGAALRQVGRIMSPWVDWEVEDRKKLWDEKYSSMLPDADPATMNDFIFRGVVPNAVAEQEAAQKKAMDEYIDQRGGMISVMATQIVNDPVAFAKDVGMGVLADPWLLGIGSVYKGTFAALAGEVGKIGQVAATTGKGVSPAAAHVAGVAAEAGVGAGLAAGGEALLSKEQEGEVNPERVQMAAAMVGAAGAFVGSIQAITHAVRRGAQQAANKAGVMSEQVEALVYQYAKDNKVSLDVAMDRVLKKYGVDAGEYINEMGFMRDKLLQDMPDPEAMARIQQGPAMPQGGREAAMRAGSQMETNAAIDRMRPQAERVLAGEARAAQPRPQEAPNPTDTTYSLGPVNERRLAAAQAGDEVAPMGVYGGGKGGGYGLIEEEFPPISAWTPEGREPSPTSITESAQLANMIEKVAQKERWAATGKPEPRVELLDKETSQLFTTAAFKPQAGTLTEPVMTIREFQQTSLGRSQSGKPLTGAALQNRYRQFHANVQKDSRDVYMNLTKQELREILEERSPQMREFFLQAGKKKGTRLPKAYRAGERGSVDPAMLKTAAGAGLFAALIGYGANHDWNEAIAYSLAAGAGLVFGGKLLSAYAKRYPVTKQLVKGRRNMDLDALINEWDGQGAVYERKLLQQHQAMKVVSGDTPGQITSPKEAKALREAVTDALEDQSGKLYAKLPDNGKELYKMVKQTLEDARQMGKDYGILRDAVDYYVPHLWQRGTMTTDEMLTKMFGNQTKAQAMDTIHKNTRIIPTYALGEKMGFKPRTKDIAELTTMYLKSMDQAKRAQLLMKTLENTKFPLDNQRIIQNYKTAPKTFRSLPHPKMAGKKVHPEMYPLLKSIFDTKDFNAFYRSALVGNFFLKRMNVSLSGFHLKALLFSSAFAAGPKGIAMGLLHPIRTTKGLADLFKGRSPWLQILHDSNHELSGELDAGLRNGLVLNMVDDAGKDTFYEGLDGISSVIRSSYEKNKQIMKDGPFLKKVSAVPTAGVMGVLDKSLRGFDKLNRLSDAVMWDRAYTSLKIMTYLKKMENLAAKHPNVPVDQLRRAAAEFTNDAYGGLNWQRLAMNVENKYGNAIAHQFASPSGRQHMQAMMFAPDWTASQIRVFYKAFANKDPISRSLYQQYQYGGLLMMFTAMDALNVAFSGHHIWENKDVSTVDLGNGQRLSLSKQYFEPAKWIWKPQQSAMNKLSTGVRSGIEWGTGQKYLRYGGMAPPIESNLGHFGSKLMPIWAQSGVQAASEGSLQGAKSGVAGLLGFPIYGTENVAKGWK